MVDEEVDWVNLQLKSKETDANKRNCVKQYNIEKEQKEYDTKCYARWVEVKVQKEKHFENENVKNFTK